MSTQSIVEQFPRQPAVAPYGDQDWVETDPRYLVERSLEPVCPQIAPAGTRRPDRSGDRVHRPAGTPALGEDRGRQP